MSIEHLQLLRDYGIPVDLPKEEPLKQQPYILTCCGPIETRSGSMVCVDCGKVLQDKVMALDYEPTFSHQYRHQDSKALGGNEHWYTEKKRFYQPLTHFRQHLNSYLGKRQRVIPEWLLDTLKVKIDIKQKDAYIKVKQHLKDYGKACYYKDIYSILYQLGATEPKFIYPDDIEQEFKIWYHHYKEEKLGGHNTPSMMMLLHLFLKRMNHTPYYDVTFLKSKKLRTRIFDIDSEILRRRTSLTGGTAFAVRWNATAIARE